MALLDKEYLLSLGKWHPELLEYLEKNPPTPISYDSHVEFRTTLNQLNADIVKALGPHPDIKITEPEYTTRDGTKLRVKLYQPVNPPAQGSPLIVMFHGGGFCMGAPESEELASRNFVHAFGATVVSGAYRLAPEFKFPVGIKDAWDCLKWAAANAKTWGADSSAGFIVGGTSAGGNITAVLTHIARDEKLSPKLTGSYLNVPALVVEGVLPGKYSQYALSYKQNTKVPVIPAESLDMLYHNIGVKGSPDLLVWFDAFNNPNGHKDLPPAYFQINGLDPVRDEALVYEKVLSEEHGIKTRLDVYAGLPHDHSRFFPTLSDSEKFHKDQTAGIGWLLGRTPDWSKVITKVNLSNTASH